MNINILRYSLFGIAGGQEVDRNFSYIYDLYSIMMLFNFRMLTDFVLISFIKPEECKTLNIIISGYVNNIIIQL